jgi:hypothetical protein
MLSAALLLCHWQCGRPVCAPASTPLTLLLSLKTMHGAIHLNEFVWAAAQQSQLLACMLPNDGGWCCLC